MAEEDTPDDGISGRQIYKREEKRDIEDSHQPSWESEAGESSKPVPDPISSNGVPKTLRGGTRSVPPDVEMNDPSEPRRCCFGAGKCSNPRGRIMKTMCLAASASALGVSSGLRGPAFLDLQLITHSDVRQASFFFTAYSVGNVLGALALGLLYDRLRRPARLLLLCLLGLAACTLLLPWCSAFPSMLFAHLLLAAFAGGLDTVSNAALMGLWGKEGETAMQFLHFSYGLGGIISPLVAEPFLAGVASEGATSFPAAAVTSSTASSLPFDNRTDTGFSAVSLRSAAALLNASDPSVMKGNYTPWKNISARLYSTTQNLFIPTDSTFQTSYVHSITASHLKRTTISDMISTNPFTGSATESSKIVTEVWYAYMICALYMLIVALPFLVIVVRDQDEKRDSANKSSSVTEPSFRQPLPRGLFLGLMMIVCAFYFIYYCVEDTFTSLLATFVVRQLLWSRSDGARISSVVWASSAAGRFLSIFAVNLLSSAQLILVCCASLTASMLAFLLLARFQLDVGIWVCTALAALAMGPVFATGFTWMEQELLRVTGRVVSAAMVASSVGTMVNPVLTGFLLQEFSPMFFCYVLLGECVLCLLVFLLLLALARCYVGRRFSLHGSLNMEIHVPESAQCTRL